MQPCISRDGRAHEGRRVSLMISQALLDSALDPIDARALLRHALKVGDAFLIANHAQRLTGQQAGCYRELVERRRAGEPVAYIVGTREFFSLEFAVSPEVLIPRPETELLVDFVLGRLQPGARECVLDLGTGSGCIAVSIAKARPAAAITAVDVSAVALAVARENAARHDVANVEFLVSDWFTALSGRRFGIIVSNPPYVAGDDPHLGQGDLRFEPRDALVSGADGLTAVRAIVAGARAHLAPGGVLAFEHGYNQASPSREILVTAGYLQVSSLRDLAGIERVTHGTFNGIAGPQY